MASTAIGVLSLTVGLMPSGADAEIVGKTRYNTDYASASFYNECVGAYMDVGRNKEKSMTSTSLYYEVYNWCDNYTLIAYGWGPIPNDAFTGNARSGKVSLNVDVSSVPDFYTYGTPLVANLYWVKNNLAWDSFAGHSESGYASGGSTWVFRSNGNYKSFAAAVSGTTNIFTPSQGYLSDSVNMYREFEKIK
jgi:hypothetical protein